MMQGRSTRIKMTGPNPALLKQVREDMGKRAFRSEACASAINAIAGKLADGAGLHLKYGSGADLSRVLSFDFQKEVTRLEISPAYALTLVEMAAEVCLKNPGWGNGATLFLTELKTLDDSIIDKSNWSNRLAKFEPLLKDLVTFKSLQPKLKGQETLVFHGAPLFPVAGNRAETMLAVKNNHLIEDLELAVEAWMDGDISPNSINGRIELEELMRELDSFLN